MVGILDKPFLLGGFGLFQGLYTLVSGRVLRVFFFPVVCFRVVFFWMCWNKSLFGEATFYEKSI